MTGTESDTILDSAESMSPEDQETTATEADEPGAAGAPGRRIRITATHIAGLATLAVGLSVGYLARPLLAPAVDPAPAGESTTRVADTPGQDPAASGAAAEVAAESGGGPEQAQPPAEADAAARRQAFATQIVARVRHFRGDPAAPVTLVEFGDFQ